jgi:hypothetical protein
VRQRMGTSGGRLRMHYRPYKMEFLRARDEQIVRHANAWSGERCEKPGGVDGCSNRFWDHLYSGFPVEPEKHLTTSYILRCFTRDSSRPKHGTTIGRHPHELQGKLAHEPTAAPHTKATPKDSKIRLCS